MLFLVGSCNLYAPLEGGGSDLDHLELGRKHLAKGDFDAAIAEFSAIGDLQTQREQLCTTYLSKAGFTISILVKTLVSTSSSVLGNTARRVMPWNADKQAAADAAKVQCSAFQTNASTDDASKGVLFKTLSSFLHCSLLIAKTDQVRAVDDTACATDGPKLGVLVQGSISTSVAGTIDSTHPGMCTADATACLNDFLELNPSQLGNSGLQDLQDVYNGLPADLRSSGTTAPSIRIALKNTLN